MKSHLHFDGMTWPNPDHADDLNYRLRYSEKSITRGNQLSLASICGAYRQLIDMPQKSRNKRIAQIRKAMAAVGGRAE